MAHFFEDTGAGWSPAAAMKVAVEETLRVGVWGARINGQLLIPSTNDPSIAVVVSQGTPDENGTIHNIQVRGLQEGNVMLEARLGRGGPVWAFAQIVVGKKGSVASAVGAAAVIVARRELAAGAFEDDGNPNTGPRVDQYEQLFGFHGLAWCAMFVYFCYDAGAASLGVKNPLPKIAAARALKDWAQNNDKLVLDPVAGDVLIVKPGSHVGLVTGPPVAGKVPSIEGNTWSHGTEDNHRDGVYEKKHALASCFYVRV